MMILTQVVMIAYAFCMAMFQSSILKGMRSYWPINNPYSRPFHAFGWFMAAIVGVVLAILQGDAWFMIASLLLSALWYSLVFDGVIGWKVYDDFFYLGDAADSDRWELQLFGEKAGLIKAGAAAGLILLLNILI